MDYYKGRPLKDYICHKCGRIFKSEEDLIYPYVCIECEKIVGEEDGGSKMDQDSN
jgi:DNA-directed RNA polymerase subunit RPC12/RpoP